MKIVWTIDSQCLDEGVQQCAIAALKSILSGTQAEVLPVYLYFPSSLELSSSFDADALRSVRGQAQRMLDQLLGGPERRGVRPVKVLLQLPAGNGGPIDAITGYADSVHADLILAATHAHTGYARLVQGSFVETLLLHSRVPLLTVSPKTRPNGTFKDLLFATDFSEEAWQAFPRALEFAKALGLTVTLFHHGTKRDADAASREWMSAARDAGVICSLIHDDRKDVPLPQLLLDLAASSQGRVLAMVTHAEPTSPKMGTSSTRQMIEQSTVPLWTFHPPGQASGTAAAI